MSLPQRRIAFALAVACMSAYCAANLHIGTDITNFMPDGGRARLAALSRKLAASELSRSMTLTVSANGDIDRAVAAARDLVPMLADIPEVAWVRTHFREDAFASVLDLYSARRYYFASPNPETEIPALLSDASLRARAQALLRELRQPTSTFLKPLAAKDPLGILQNLMARSQASQPSLPTHDGHLVSRDHRFALILLSTVHSHFASGVQAAFLDELQRSISAIKSRWGDDVEIEMSGANRVAVRAEESIRRDVRWIGACTFFGVAALFLLFFRTLMAFVLASLPALFGMLAATTASLVALGELDGLTIAFGTALIGVAIDYAIHTVNHHALSGPGVGAEETVRRLAPSLILGALTTMASFAGLTLTTSPAFRELGFFSIAGIGAALAATLFFLPAFLGDKRRIPDLSQSAARALRQLVVSLRDKTRLLRALTLFTVLAAAAWLPHLHWVDDLSRLGNIDETLVEEEKRVRARMPAFESGRFIIASASDVESALEKNDLVYQRLQPLLADGALGGIRSLHDVLWSRSLQERNLAALRRQSDLDERVNSLFHEVGFRRDAFATAFEDLRHPPAPLTLDDLRQSPLAPLLETMAVNLGDDVALITHLRDARDLDRVRQSLRDLEDVVVFDQRSFVNEVYAEFRMTTIRQVLLGTFLVGAVLLLRYRSWRPACAALLPSLLVVVYLLGAFSWFGTETNLVHVIALMMVMGMGVDYGVFLVDTANDRDALGPTMLSLLLSCLTTVFVFGALAISEHPALRAIGTTTGAGVLLAFILAPLSLIIVAPDGAKGPHS